MLQILDYNGGTKLVYLTAEEAELKRRLSAIKEPSAQYFKERLIGYHWLLPTETVRRLKLTE